MGCIVGCADKDKDADRPCRRRRDVNWIMADAREEDLCAHAVFVSM